jgi:hypothetical protein
MRERRRRRPGNHGGGGFGEIFVTVRLRRRRGRRAREPLRGDGRVGETRDGRFPARAAPRALRAVFVFALPARRLGGVRLRGGERVCGALPRRRRLRLRAGRVPRGPQPRALARLLPFLLPRAHGVARRRKRVRPVLVVAAVEAVAAAVLRHGEHGLLLREEHRLRRGHGRRGGHRGQAPRHRRDPPVAVNHRPRAKQPTRVPVRAAAQPVQALPVVHGVQPPSAERELGVRHQLQHETRLAVLG